VSVNDAYRALKDPLKRAEILLARHGAKVPERAPADPALLMEVMELREALAEAKAERDLAKAHRLAGSVQAMEDAALSTLRKALHELTQGVEHGREHAQKALGRLRYFRRFHDEVARFEEELLE
jgi:molecular chaperone HscB